ncbi:MAG TPA: hypothetical protein VKP30_16080 [Polyangiaceae bacterium]|nr:hypothetical protein [Polyangiaceae bacterium]
MSKPKSNPPIHSSGRRPLDSIDSLHPSSLPPELGSLDMAWDDDPSSVASIDLLQNSDLMDIEADANERTTAVPDIPMDQLVRSTMAEADARESGHRPVAAEVLPGAVEPPRVATAGAQARFPSSSDAALTSQDSAATSGGALARTKGYHMADRRLPQFGHERTMETGIAEPASSNEKPPASATPQQRSPSPSTEPAPRLESRLTSPPTMRRGDTGQLRNQMKDCYATGDFSGALEFSEALLHTDPGDLEAQRFVTSCRDVLTQMLLSRIGSLQQHVQMALSADELRWLNLDHRAGFLLSLIDGTLTVEELLDVSGMARLESLRIISALLDQRVLRLYAE